MFFKIFPILLFDKLTFGMSQLEFACELGLQQLRLIFGSVKVIEQTVFCFRFSPILLIDKSTFGMSQLEFSRELGYLMAPAT